MGSNWVDNHSEGRPGMNEGRAPWWVLSLAVACLAFLCFACYVHIAGPEPTGLVLRRAPPGRAEPALVVRSVEPGSPAARAGLRPGDVLPMRGFRELTFHETAGREYRFDVERGTGPSAAVTVRLNRTDLEYWLSARGVNPIIAVFISVVTLMLGAIIVFARPHDSIARWGALVLASFSAFPLWYGLGRPAGMMTALREIPMVARAALLIAPTLASMGPALIVTFLAGFPRSALTERGLRRLFWVTAPIGTPVVVYGVWAPVYSPERVFEMPAWLGAAFLIAAAAFCSAGGIVMARNYTRLEDQNERRRVRVVVFGFIVTILGTVAQFTTVLATGTMNELNQLAMSGHLYWLFAPFFLAVPVCIAYAILRHRIFDIRIIIRQGIQYAAAKGLLLSILPLLAGVLALDLLRHGDRPLLEILGRRGWLYGVIAASALLLHSRQKTWLTALDRRFFRERYDAQRVLREVVDDVRASPDFNAAAARVVSQIEAALHLETAAILLRQPGELEFRTVAFSPVPPAKIPSTLKIFGLLRLLGKPLELSQTGPGWVTNQLPPEESQFLKESRLEWLFPVSLGATGLECVLALGRKKSEEPYSTEDQGLLAAVAGSLALLLERAPTGLSASRRPEHSAETPVLAGRYRLGQQLGRGGMGMVYEALDTELERRVAVKLIRSDWISNPEAVARFKREARAAAALSHPNVVTVFDFGVAEDHDVYLVMELLHGRTLREELKEKGRISPARAGNIISGVCAAMSTAHANRLLHRDLKPENIFLAEVGRAEVTKVLDFGVAKPLTATESTLAPTDTGPGVLVGTLLYMSPEQLRGEPPSEHWDLWSLAVVAYEALTGAYPFPSGHPVVPAPIACRNHVPDAPASWDSFFERALSPDPRRRPADAAQLAREFRAALPLS
jgi:eukaryotic-like serine/threonine-protein kinase